MELHPTRDSLPEAVRAQTVHLLSLRLADCIDLQTQAKQAHWNVKGPVVIRSRVRGPDASNPPGSG